MIGVQTDIFRFDQQFLRLTYSQLTPLLFSNLDGSGNIQANTPNYFTSQDNLNGRTITGISVLASLPTSSLVSLVPLGLGTPISGFNDLASFLITIVRKDQTVYLSDYPVSLLADINPINNAGIGYQRKFDLTNVDWSASYVRTTTTYVVPFPATNPSILFNVQYQ